MEAGWAADFFLLAHDEFTGKLLVSKGLLGCGLAASQLAELVAVEQLTVDDGYVVTIDDGPSSGVAAFVMDTIAEQAVSHPARAWIETSPR